VKKRSATRAAVSVFGGLVTGLGGVEHGIGEALQGSVAPAGLVFPSWPGAEFFHSVAGEPAMSLVPNLLASGLLTILVSLGFLVWAIGFPHRKSGGPVLLGLSVVLLLVGGGFGPPLLGIIVGITATLAGPRAGSFRPPTSLGRALGALWPWIFGAAIAAWLLVIPGTQLLDRVFGVRGLEAAVPVFIFLAFATLGLVIVTALARDRLAGQAAPGSLPHDPA
jgi:hypothetical protein